MNKLRASIDIGSNSVLLLIAETSEFGLVEKLKRSEVTSLGRDLDKSKVFSEDSMRLTEEALASYVNDVKIFGIKPEEIIITATEAARVAKNSRQFFDDLEQKYSIRIAIISSVAEAYFSAKGILLDQNFDQEVVTVLDIGGASSELIHINTKSSCVQKSVSLPIGSVRASQWLEDGYFVQNLQKIFLDFRSDLDQFQTKKLICVAGTVTSLANMHLENKDFREGEVHGLNLKIEEIDMLFKKYSQSYESDFLEKYPFLGKRARSIKGGLHLVYHLLHRLLVKEVMVSTYGLRYGTLVEGIISKDQFHG
jgi:exopolyphosphatase/guanosine-5'-triphosphate,3'-diphosphate pyrophosphatase